MMKRREFLCSGSLLLAGALSIGGPGSLVAQAAPVFRPEDFGAAGDGRTNDTAAIQACIDAAPPGAAIRFRPDAVYRIDTNWQPTFHDYGGLRLRRGQRIELNGAELRALPSRSGEGSVVQAYRVDGWSIVGPGRIVGERDIHAGRGGEWGMGVSAWSASSWRIENVEISNCWGDGIMVGHAERQQGAFCENFLISDVDISHCRRNGISVVAGRNGEIRSPRIRDIAGTAPQAGIDLEPDDARHPNRNIRITGAAIRDVDLGIAVTVANRDVTISGGSIEGGNSGILIGGNVDGLTISDNPRIASLVGNREGGAIRTAAAREAVIANLRVSRNGLYGGGFFVVDMAVAQYRNLAFVENRIHASNPGARVARMLAGGRFTDNVCIIERVAGARNESFVQLAGVTYGGNRYENRSGRAMYAQINGGAHLGGDVYGAMLRRGPNL